MASHSSLQNYKDCPTKYLLKDVAHLHKVDEEASEHHLRYGSAMHLGLKGLYLGDTLEAAIRAFSEAYPKQLDPEDEAKTQANGIIALKEYAKRWKDEDTKWRVISVEEKDHMEYGGEDSFTVMLDLVMENIAHGGIYGVDHKIVGGKKATLSFDFWNQFEPNTQITKYVGYVKKKYGDCSGFYINAIGMRWLQKKYKDSPAGLNLRFERQMFNRNNSQLIQDERDTAYWIQRIEQSRETGVYGMNTSSCRFCEYRPLCAAGWTWPDDKDLITIEYEVRERKQKETASAN